MILVGTTGEVYPAALIPRAAKKRGAVIIEINPDFSSYTLDITDHFLPMEAAKAARALSPLLGLPHV
jgi:NAD-dependent deacetylase